MTYADLMHNKVLSLEKRLVSAESARDSALATVATLTADLKAREYEVSRMRDVIRETEHERELLDRYKRDLDEIGRVMGCDHKDDGYLRCVTDELAKVERLEGTVATLTGERNKLQAFKDWVHAYLDGKGIPHHPPGVHGSEGCRIGDRMDYVFNTTLVTKEQS